MFKYTQSAILDTFDLIKKFIFISLVVIQISYIGYISFRLVTNGGNFIINIILLVISLIYFIYYVGTYREFYTEEHKRNRFIAKWVFKSIKYVISVYMLVVAVLELLNNKSNNDNISIIVIVLMILSIITNIVFDIIIMLIDKQTEIINNSLRYDMEVFRKNNKFFASSIKRLGFDIEEKFPTVDNDRLVDKIISINHKQEQKSLRRKSFLKKHK